MRGGLLTGFVLAALALVTVHARAGDIRVLSANVFTDVLDEHFPRF